MAKQSLTAQLAAKPLGYQIGVLIGTMIFLGVFYYQFFYSSLQEDLKSAKSGYARQEKKNKELKKREKEWKQMVKDKEELDRTLSSNQVSLPATAALASFIGHMQRQAAVAGVSFKNWSRKEEEPVTGYVKVPISIEVVGSFHQILKYFHLLGKTKRIITVENFSLTPEKNDDADDVLLLAHFRATTFRQPDGAAQAVEAASQESGMIEKAKDARAKKEAQVEAVAGETDEKGNPVGNQGGKSGLEKLKNPGAQ